MKKLFLIVSVIGFSNFAFTASKKAPAPESVQAFMVNSDEAVSIADNLNSTLIPKVNSEFSLKTEASLFREKIFHLENTKSMAEISQILRTISSMEGIEYYSTGDKKWETLYHKATFIDSPESKNPVEEEEVKEALSSDGKQLYALLEDNSLGTCVYQVSYFETENEIAMNFFLVEPIKLGPVKAVKPENLVINLVVLKENPQTSDNLTVYLNVRAKYVKISMIENRLNKSFERRIDSMYSWFEDKIKK